MCRASERREPAVYLAIVQVEDRLAASAGAQRDQRVEEDMVPLGSAPRGFEQGGNLFNGTDVTATIADSDRLFVKLEAGRVNARWRRRARTRPSPTKNGKGYITYEGGQRIVPKVMAISEPPTRLAASGALADAR
jgi:hypothetical protein